MADFSKFRTAVSGFNRTDVVNYIESTSSEHQKALRKLTDERDKLNETAKDMYDIDNFADMVADETNCPNGDPEELLAFLSEVGHPVLSMDPLDI